jgi:hypothetical protein
MEMSLNGVERRWVLLGAPTDADYATWIIQRRSQQNKPLRGSKTIKRLSRNKVSPIIVVVPSV